MFIQLICSASVFGQDLEVKVQQLLEKNKLNELLANIETIKSKYPNNAIPFYIEALIEKDGEKAIENYRNFIKRFPESSYASQAKFKIAQYYFAKGLYPSARTLLDEILKTFPQLSFADHAHYLLIRCLIALDRSDQANNEADIFSERYDDSPFKKIVKSDLKQVEKFRADEPEVKESKVRPTLQPEPYFTIQIGAYLDQKNAINQKNKMIDLGYSAQIRARRIGEQVFHLVWVGHFETQEQAMNFGEIFKKKHDIAFRVVDGNLL